MRKRSATIMKTAFFTIASDEFMYYSLSMEASLKKFHPDIPFFRFHTKTQFGHDKAIWYSNWGRELALDYDLVIQIDSDSIVCSPLDEALAGDFEVAGVHNNSPGGIFTTTLPYKVGAELYLNAGFVAVRKAEFWADWQALNREKAQEYSFGEQDTFNELFYGEKYQTKVLDGYGTHVWYGCSSYGHYEKILYNSVTDRLELQGKEIRVIHTAGNRDYKQQLLGATPDVQTHLSYLMYDPNTFYSKRMQEAIEYQIKMYTNQGGKAYLPRINKLKEELKRSISGK